MSAFFETVAPQFVRWKINPDDRTREVIINAKVTTRPNQRKKEEGLFYECFLFQALPCFELLNSDQATALTFASE